MSEDVLGMIADTKEGEPALTEDVLQQTGARDCKPYLWDWTSSLNSRDQSDKPSRWQVFDCIGGPHNYRVD